MDFEKLPDPKLPVWMNKGEPLTLAHASKTWWQRVYGWLTWPLAQIDVDTCDEQLLTLLAYQRDITRFTGENLAAFRLRVKWAFVNAQDAGFKAGFERIFQRLNIGQIQQSERQLWLDWDVILIRINDDQLSRNNTLMMALLRQYGRTCRRYFFDVLNTEAVTVHHGTFSNETAFCSAVQPFMISSILINGWETPEFSPNTAFAGASYVLKTVGESGDVSWRADGNAIVYGGGVTLTGQGKITITATDGLGRQIKHSINPRVWFVCDGVKRKWSEFLMWCGVTGRRAPTDIEITNPHAMSTFDLYRVCNGSLWGEWGDMKSYGWPGDGVPLDSWASWYWNGTTVVGPGGTSVYGTILAGRHASRFEAPNYNSNGSSTPINITNTNLFQCCYVIDVRGF